jgi:thioredoxin 1
MIAPILDEVADDYKGRLKIAKLNIDENPDVSSKYGVKSIPTMIIFKDGKEVDRLVGAMPENMIRQRVEEWV